MASSHPSEHFAQADSLLTGIIDNYRNSADATEMAEVVSMLEHAVRVARDREFRVQDSIKGALAWPPDWCTRLQSSCSAAAAPMRLMSVPICPTAVQNCRTRWPAQKLMLCTLRHGSSMSSG